MGEGCTPLLPRRLHGGRALPEMRVVHADRQLQGPRRLGHAVAAARAGRASRCWRTVPAMAARRSRPMRRPAGCAATIMAPASTSPAKTVQMRAHGAEVELIPGTRQDTSDAAVRRAESVFYASHNWHPFFLQGTKTLAYELWEDLGFAAPDHVVDPVRRRVERAGLRARLRRAAAGRDDRPDAAALGGAAGELRADRRGRARARSAVRCSPTIAEGTAIAAPIRLPEVVAALRLSGGGGVLLSETEIELEVHRAGQDRHLRRADLRPGGRGLSPSCSNPARSGRRRSRCSC